MLLKGGSYIEKIDNSHGRYCSQADENTLCQIRKKLKRLYRQCGGEGNGGS